MTSFCVCMSAYPHGSPAASYYSKMTRPFPAAAIFARSFVFRTAIFFNITVDPECLAALAILTSSSVVLLPASKTNPPPAVAILISSSVVFILKLISCLLCSDIGCPPLAFPLAGRVSPMRLIPDALPHHLQCFCNNHKSIWIKPANNSFQPR